MMSCSASNNLHDAAKNLKLNKVRTLLRRKIDPNTVDEDGNTPLHTLAKSSTRYNTKRQIQKAQKEYKALQNFKINYPPLLKVFRKMDSQPNNSSKQSLIEEYIKLVNKAKQLPQKKHYNYYTNEKNILKVLDFTYNVLKVENMDTKTKNVVHQINQICQSIHGYKWNDENAQSRWKLFKDEFYDEI